MRFLVLFSSKSFFNHTTVIESNEHVNFWGNVQISLGWVEKLSTRVQNISRGGGAPWVALNGLSKTDVNCHDHMVFYSTLNQSYDRQKCMGISLGGLPVFRFCTVFFIKPVFFSITGKPVFTTYQKAQYIIVNCNVEY